MSSYFKDIQQNFLQQIKEKLPTNHSFVEELAERLDISTDSAYRRIRGEKTLSFDEIQLLSTYYDVSVDTLFNLKNNSVIFNYRSVDYESFTFIDFLRSILTNLEMIKRFENKELIFAAKDIPIFHYFQFPELTWFKSFFWMKMILEYPEYADQTFSCERASKEIEEIASRIWHTYIGVPSIEIWSNETINVTLRQIEYCWDCGIFESKEDALGVCDKMMALVNHIQQETALGFKFINEGKEVGQENNFQLYYNEVTISDNTILFNMDETKVAYVTHNLFNILTTSNPDFCNQTNHYLKKILRKSNLISNVSEKERNIFFRKMREKVSGLIDKIT